MKIFKRVWDTFQQTKSVRKPHAKTGGFYGKGYSFPMLAPKLIFLSAKQSNHTCYPVWKNI